MKAMKTMKAISNRHLFVLGLCALAVMPTVYTLAVTGHGKEALALLAAMWAVISVSYRQEARRLDAELTRLTRTKETHHDDHHPQERP